MMSNRADENSFGIEPAHIQQLSSSREGLNRRMMAYEFYRKIPMPTQKDRAWRKTIIDEFNAKDYLFQPHIADLACGKNKVEKEGEEIIIHYNPNGVKNKNENKLVKTGILVCSLTEAEESYPKLLADIAGKIVLPQESKFSALAQMLDSDGLLIHIAKDAKIETPIHLLIHDDQQNNLSAFHLMIILEENSSASILHEWSDSKKDVKRLLAGVVEIRTGRNAYLEMTELQTWSESQWTFLHERAELLENSQLDWSVYADGGKYARTFLGVNLVGEQAQATITGICLNVRPAQLDFDTFQHHHAVGTSSDLFFKGAMANDGRSIWTGMIRVEQKAAKTDSYQANRNLILCGNPLVESIPGLEILNDDVRCSHGVSAGEIDFDQLFYLSSRGIPEKEGKQIIAQGFLNSGLERIKNKDIRKRLETRIQSRLEELFCE